jgi:S-formylglutathione hydrolase
MSSVKLAEVASPHLPAAVQYAILSPDEAAELPMCLLLLGRGGTREALLDLQPLFEEGWQSGIVLPMRIATLTAGLDYYMEEPSGPIRWDTFLVSNFVPLLRSQFDFAQCAIAGISAGGYGALKIAFANAGVFDAVAAMQPMLEPAVHASDVRPRNRLHHTAGGPAQLVGQDPDPVLWESNNPANRALRHSRQIQDAGLRIYLEAADNDFLNAHDGAEFLHRLLWQQDISHEYRLMQGADHGGASMRPRLAAMFSWLSSVWRKPAIDLAAEQNALDWLRSDMQSKPPAGATTTNSFIHFLRSNFEPIRSQAAQRDPTTTRRYGEL